MFFLTLCYFLTRTFYITYFRIVLKKISLVLGKTNLEGDNSEAYSISFSGVLFFSDNGISALFLSNIKEVFVCLCGISFLFEKLPLTWSLFNYYCSEMWHIPCLIKCHLNFPLMKKLLLSYTGLCCI